MNVAELKELLDDYGDHLPVLIGNEGENRHIIEVAPGQDNDGMAAAILWAAL